MSTSTITVSGEVAKRLQQLAQLRQQNVETLLDALLDQAWPQQGNRLANSSASNDAIEDVATPEMQTFIALHPILKEQYFGQYVAIYQGKLVDHDASHEALYRRIDAQYPNEFVWISPVEEEAIPTLSFRSPRLEWHEPI